MLRDPCLIPLSHQHHNGLALCVMTGRSLAADASAANVGRLGRRVVERYDLELVNHFALEEEVLFPVCGGMPLIAKLVAEHRSLERMVAMLREAPSAEVLADFCELLRSHIQREEKELFEEIQRTAPRDALERAGAEIDRRAVRIRL